MSGRNRVPMNEGGFGLGHHPPHHLPHPHPGLHPAILAQNEDTQGLLADNQRLATTHVALKQEVEAAQHELQRMARFADSLRPDKDVQMRELYDNSVRLQADLRALENMKGELHKVHTDIKEFSAARQELNAQLQVMNQDLARLNADLQQVPALKSEIEHVKQELQRARAAIDSEKKGYAENYEHGLVMEKNLVGMARELEKLRAEIANANVPNPAAAYNANYGNPYPTAYNTTNHAQQQGGAEGYPQYGAVPVPGPWGAYDVQQGQGHRPGHGHGHGHR